VARTVRIELRKRGHTAPAAPDQITDIVVTEVVKAIEDPG